MGWARGDLAGNPMESLESTATKWRLNSHGGPSKCTENGIRLAKSENRFPTPTHFKKTKKTERIIENETKQNIPALLPVFN